MRVTGFRANPLRVVLSNGVEATISQKLIDSFASTSPFEQHPDDIVVDRFAAAMKEKLADINGIGNFAMMSSIAGRREVMAGLIEAARDVIASASDTYKKRNGHLASFEDDSGEKCWIVPFDAFEGLRSAVAADTPPQSRALGINEK